MVNTTALAMAMATNGKAVSGSTPTEVGKAQAQYEQLIEERLNALQSESMAAMMRVQTELLRASGEYLRGQGFAEILPVIISPITDPLCHSVYDAAIKYYDSTYKLTKSMILHKQLSLFAHDRIFCFSPNIRLEPADRGGTGRHLIEFSQLDLEVKGATRDDILVIGEGLVLCVIKAVKDRCRDELAFFGRELAVPGLPFERVRYCDAYDRYGKTFEDDLSMASKGPVWLIDIPIDKREFYDREDPERPGILLDFDLIWPEGYGEAVSGGEREYEYERIITRMAKSGVDPNDFSWYLKFAMRGLPRSAGFGIGLERFTRYLCGLESVAEARQFPKLPGRPAIL